MFFPPTVVHQLKLGKRECPSKISCSSSKGRYHAGEEKGAGLPVKLGPGRAAVFKDFCPLSEIVRPWFTLPIPVMRVEVSEVATPNPAEIKSPGV